MSVVAVFALLSGPLFAKGPEMSAIDVFPTGDSQSYVQISGFALNQKNEVHLCSGAPAISKGNYGKLPKVTLGPGMSLERAKDGMLLLSRGGAPECVVPGNLKLEKDEGETPATLADKSEMTGQVVARSGGASDSIPALTRGSKIVLVATLDTEMAEFLLAQRGAKIPSWLAYLAKYPAGPHSGEAKAALSGFYTQDGQIALAAYQATLKDPQPNYSKLQAAKAALDSAVAKAPSNPSTDALAAGIQQESAALNTKGLSEIALYRSAVTTQTSGYAHLQAAEALSQYTLTLSPKSPETSSLSQACIQERTILDHRFVDFTNKLSARRPDEAYQAIQPLRPFAAEYPRVQAALQSLYSYHVEQANKDAAANDPQGQLAELQKAAEAEPGPEIDALVSKARVQAQDSSDHAAVTMATTMSKSAEEDKDYVKAYEVLNDLTPPQRALVADRLAELKDRYVAAALSTAKDLQRTRLPIKGLDDERGVQHAYTLLNNCYSLTSDANLQDRIQILGGTLSAYYQSQAKHYLDRPDGTGANVGYTYLVQALQYKGADAEAIRDEMTRANAARDLRSRLSIKVDFRDQTSRREAVDFAEQLTDSLATGLETANLAVIKVYRPKDSTAVPPNFFLTGDVLQNTKSNTVERVSKTSKYGSGDREIVTDEWNAANRDWESASQAKATADALLQGAVASRKKNLIADAKRQDDEAQKKVEALRLKLDSTTHFRSEQIERPYTYTEQINHLTATVELQFKIVDSSGKVVVPPIQIPKTEPKTYSTLENVKSDDTMGVRVEGEVPTENQFLEKVEDDARDDLLKLASEKVSSLPAIILLNADRKAADGDNDGAAEQYILYLNSTAGNATPERKRGQQFLETNYNFRAYGEPPKA